MLSLFDFATAASVFAHFHRGVFAAASEFSTAANKILTGSVPTKDVIKRMLRMDEREVGFEPKYYAS